MIAQGIVFDCDGTLLDTMTLHWQSWQESCAHFELPITLPWWLAQAGKPADEILRLLCEMEVGRRCWDRSIHGLPWQRVMS